MIDLFRPQYASNSIIFFLCVELASASRNVFPKPTLAGLRAAELELQILPTPNPWSPPELLRRFAGDPAICGWVEGDASNIVSCNSGYTCGATLTYVGCCSTAGLSCDVLQTTCYDVRSKSDGAAFDNAALVCGTPEPYCATYRYASGSQGFGCAVTSNYNKTVLTTTTSHAVPFGQDPTTASSPSLSTTTPPTASISTAPETSSTASPSRFTTDSPTPVNVTLLSGGAIAGIVAGCIVALAAITWLVIFCLKHHRRQIAPSQSSAQPGSFQDGYGYAPYAKPPDTGGLHSPPWFHSRHPSDLHSQHSELDVRPFSPETLNTLSPKMSPELSDGTNVELAELPAATPSSNLALPNIQPNHNLKTTSTSSRTSTSETPIIQNPTPLYLSLSAEIRQFPSKAPPNEENAWLLVLASTLKNPHTDPPPTKSRLHWESQSQRDLPTKPPSTPNTSPGASKPLSLAPALIMIGGHAGGPLSVFFLLFSAPRQAGMLSAEPPSRVGNPSRLSGSIGGWAGSGAGRGAVDGRGGGLGGKRGKMKTGKENAGWMVGDRRSDAVV